MVKNVPKSKKAYISLSFIKIIIIIIAKMRTFLNQQQMQILVNALVISSLDYCNALYYGADCYVSKQLQMLQNRACKTIFGLKRKESVSEYMSI